MVHFVSTSKHVTTDQLRGGFFEGWPNPPTPETHLRLLRSSGAIVLAFDQVTDEPTEVGLRAAPDTRVVGMVTAITDGVLSAHIPLLEVLPAYRRQGIGRELVRRMLEHLGDVYMIDLMCDPELLPFYETLGLRPMQGAGRRAYGRQAGRPTVEGT